MAAAPTADADAFLEAFGRAADRVSALMHGLATGAGRLAETGARGEGGDRTLVLDADAEAEVFAELDALHAAGHRFSVVSEERGTVDYGSPDALVVIDPIDGSMNAKRGLPHHAVSIALAVGDDVASRGTMADVVCGLVEDIGVRERWTAVLGRGATLAGAPLVGPDEERVTGEGLLELVAIESAHPRHVAASGDALLEHVHRLRVIGAIAIAMCHVAAGRVDAMAALWRCRSVDAAAAQLIVRESGGRVAFGDGSDPLGAPLDLLPHVPVCCARTDAGLARALQLPHD